MIQLKICGMKQSENIAEVVMLQPDFLGFIFYEKSPRYVAHIPNNIPSNIQKTGVFVNSTIASILEKIKIFQLQAIQLHGDESEEFCKELQEKASYITIIKAVGIKDTYNFNQLKKFEPYINYFLFDTKGSYPGGNGYTFNWNSLQNYSLQTPYFLSGGIGLEELQKLKDFFNTSASKYCVAIDVNSKFETKPGIKNIKQLQQFKTQLQTIKI